MPILECRKLKKTYHSKDSRTVAVTNFSYEFPDTGIVAIQGKSGSGKSTLLCLLAMVEEPDSGQLFYDGKEYSSLTGAEKLRFIREETSFVFQHYGLFEDMTVWENIILPLRMVGETRSQTKESIGFLLSHFGLEGYEKRVVSTLSGGEKQRVALIRALVKSPRILFADEPTGALDEENGEEVMKMLSSMSGSCLIIMVSHNTELVERYADRIITLKDGMKVRSKVVNEKRNDPAVKKKRRRSSSWGFGFLKIFLKKDVKRNAMTFASGLIGLLSIIACAGYFLGSPRSIDENGKKSLEYLSASLSKKETISVSDSPLVLTKQSKPTMEEAKECLKGFEGVSIEEDLSYFFPSQSLYAIGESEYSDALFTPLFDATLQEYGKGLLIEGQASEEDDIGICYVNDVFLRSHPLKVGDKISLSLQIPVQNSDIKDEIDLDLNFILNGISKEFPFLNTPKVYYSYRSFQAVLYDSILPSFSEAFQHDFTIADFLSIYPESYLGNGYKIFFHDPAHMEKAFEMMDQDSSLCFESTVYTAVKSFSDLSNAFQMCLLLLLGISVLGMVGITGMSFLSLFLKRKQDIALLFSLGATRAEAISIFVFESSLVSGAYALLSYLFYPYVEQGFNWVLNQSFGIDNLVNLPTYMVIGSTRVPLMLFFLAFSILVGVLSCLFPIAFSMRGGLRKELRDE